MKKLICSLFTILTVIALSFGQHTERPHSISIDLQNIAFSIIDRANGNQGMFFRINYDYYLSERTTLGASSSIEHNQYYTYSGRHGVDVGRVKNGKVELLAILKRYARNQKGYVGVYTDFGYWYDIRQTELSTRIFEDTQNNQSPFLGAGLTFGYKKTIKNFFIDFGIGLGAGKALNNDIYHDPNTLFGDLENSIITFSTSFININVGYQF